MRNYSAKGFNFSYPDTVVVTGRMPSVRLARPGGSDFLYLDLFVRYSDLDDYFQRQVDSISAKNSCQIIRIGCHSKFPGSKEFLVKMPSGFYHWLICAPLEDRVFEIALSVNGDDYAAIGDIWAPVIESMEFDLDIIRGVSAHYDVRIYDWTVVSPGQAGHFNFEFAPVFKNVTLMDSSLEHNADAVGLAFDRHDIYDILERDKIVKIDRAAVLLPISDPYMILANFYLNADTQPNLDDWNQVVESVITVDSGCLLAETDGIDLEIKLISGKYKLRVYFLPLQVEHESGTEFNELWDVYLWPTDEEEDNVVRVIKDTGRSAEINV